jgi:hypothetical protein
MGFGKMENNFDKKTKVLHNISKYGEYRIRYLVTDFGNRYLVPILVTDIW